MRPGLTYLSSIPGTHQTATSTLTRCSRCSSTLPCLPVQLGICRMTTEGAGFPKTQTCPPKASQQTTQPRAGTICSSVRVALFLQSALEGLASLEGEVLNRSRRLGAHSTGSSTIRFLCSRDHGIVDLPPENRSKYHVRTGKGVRSVVPRGGAQPPSSIRYPSGSLM